MMQSLFGFFLKNKWYFAALMAIAIFYGTFVLTHPKMTTGPQESAVVEDYKFAEEKAAERMRDPEIMSRFFYKHPVLALTYPATLGFLALLFIGGVILNSKLWTDPIFRAQWLDSGISSDGTKHWDLSMLFRVAVLFLSASVFLGVGLAWMHKTFFPQGSQNFLILLHTVLSDMLCLGLIFYFVKRSGSRLAGLGFLIPEKKIKKEIFSGWMGYLALFPVFIFVLMILLSVASFFHFEPPPHPLVNVLLEEQDSRGMIFFSMGLALFVGPVIEEVFFRGFCYPILRNKVGKIWGMIITSAFFALIHESSFAFFPVFILGMGLNYLYEKRRSLLSVTVLHLTHNTIFIAYFFFIKTFIDALTGMP